MGRKKLARNADLADFLTTQFKNGQTYYIWTHPKTGRSKSLGKDRREANRKATLMNQALADIGITARSPVTPKAKRFDAVVNDYLDWKLPQLSVASQTVYKNRIKRIAKEFGKRNIEGIDTKDLYEFLKAMPDYTYVKMRSDLIDIFSFALNTGARNGKNPARDVLAKQEPKRKRQRLTKDQYKAIYKEASQHLQVAMAIMLNTTLRPIDVANLKYSQFINGVLYVQTSKTNVIIEYEFSREAEEDIIIKSRSSGVLSPYIVHKAAVRKNASKLKNHWTQLTTEQLSTEFSRIRDRLGIGGELPTVQRPSLYEIRSAAGRWLKEDGANKDLIKALYGHTEEKTTDLYLEDDSVKHFRVKAGFRI